MTVAVAAADGADFLRAVSQICGWVYVAAWSLSFYPQPVLNYQRRATDGLTLDFPLLNVFGFSCYTISTAAFLYSPTIRAEYAARHPLSPEPTVRGNDFAFGLHAAILCVITISQFWSKLWGWKVPTHRPRPTAATLGILVGSGVAIVGIVIIVAARRDEGLIAEGGWGWIDVMYALTYVKLLLTIFKYLPQVLSHHRRRSTRGWAINTILLDVLGGVLSLVQLVIDSSLQADWSGLTGNPVKFGLANISLGFDVVFLVQHYVLYGPVAGRDDDGKAVLGEEDQESAEAERRALLG